MPDTASIRAKAIDLIRNYMGDTTAKLYDTFYQDKEEKTIRESVTELLEEYVGANRTKDILTQNGIT